MKVGRRPCKIGKEENKAVVPIVVAWNGINRRPLKHSRMRIGKGPTVRIDKLLVVEFIVGVGINLVAPHHEQFASRQAPCAGSHLPAFRNGLCSPIHCYGMSGREAAFYDEHCPDNRSNTAMAYREPSGLTRLWRELQLTPNYKLMRMSR